MFVSVDKFVKRKKTVNLNFKSWKKFIISARQYNLCMETYSKGSKESTLNVDFKAISHLRIMCKRETQRSSVRGILYILWLQPIVLFFYRGKS